MNRPTLTLKPFIFVDEQGNRIVNSSNKKIESYITARSFRNAMQNSTLPKEFVDWFIKDPYNGRARFVTHYKRELYESYKMKADYVLYSDPAFKALEDANLCDKSCLAEMDVSAGIKTKKYLLLMGAEIESNFVKFLFSQKYPGEYLMVIMEEPCQVQVKGIITFLNPSSVPAIPFGRKLF